MTANITWLLIKFFTIVILDMDSAPHVEYSDVVQCGAFADINNYPMDGLATISNSMSLLRNLNYKQTLQMMLIWNGSRLIVFIVVEDMDVDMDVDMDMDTRMIYLLMQVLI